PLADQRPEEALAALDAGGPLGLEKLDEACRVALQAGLKTLGSPPQAIARLIPSRRYTEAARAIPDGESRPEGPPPRAARRRACDAASGSSLLELQPPLGGALPAHRLEAPAPTAEAAPARPAPPSPASTQELLAGALWGQALVAGVGILVVGYLLFADAFIGT